jgi:uncharacterized protein (TIGR04255 family)
MFEKTCYKQPFIKEVILRFDFPSLIPEFEKGLPSKVSKTALRIFPIFEPQKVQTHEVQFGGEEAKTKITEKTNSIFHSLEKEKTLTISANAYVVQIRRYKTFELFTEDALQPLRALCETFPEISASRIGLRYVNVLDIKDENLNPLDWTKYVDPKLLGVTDFHEKSNLSRAFQILEYNFNEDSLKFQVGIANPDYPAKIKQRQFILDIDASSVGAFDYQEMVSKINVGHERIQKIFEASITDATRAAMKVVTDDTKQ